MSVHVYRHQDLSVSVPVRPDGRITVPIVGDVMVGGRTPEEVSEILQEGLSEYIRDPLVTTTIVGVGASDFLNRVRVTGAVGNACSFPFKNGMTVLDLVLDCGGPTEFASPNKTTIFRNNGERLRVRLGDILKKGEMTTNYYIRPGDVVTIPESLF